MDIELELTQDNPYARGFIVDYGDSTFTLETNPVTYPVEIGDEYYVVIEGDTLDTIAFEKYESSKLWHVIFDANGLINPFDTLELGRTLRIPNPDKVKFN